jgi:hypothetical protein
MEYRHPPDDRSSAGSYQRLVKGCVEGDLRSVGDHGDGTTQKARAARGIVDANRGAAGEREPSALSAAESDPSMIRGSMSTSKLSARSFMPVKWGDRVCRRGCISGCCWWVISNGLIRGAE